LPLRVRGARKKGCREKRRVPRAESVFMGTFEEPVKVWAGNREERA
jgi:hypothetical protein